MLFAIGLNRPTHHGRCDRQLTERIDLLLQFSSQGFHLLLSRCSLRIAIHFEQRFARRPHLLTCVECLAFESLFFLGQFLNLKIHIRNAHRRNLLGPGFQVDLKSKLSQLLLHFL